MSELSKILREAVDGNGVKHLTFRCPGCKSVHSVTVGGNGTWGWNGDADRPTFTPSILVRTGHFAEHYKSGDNCWCTYNNEQIQKGGEPCSFTCGICHSFVTDGRIQFLGDCTHELAGQTVKFLMLAYSGAILGTNFPKLNMLNH